MIQHIPYGNSSSDSREGRLQIQVTSSLGLIPVQDARITIRYEGDPAVIEEVDTNNIGRSEILTLTTPPLDYSLEPGSPQPYSVYNISVQADGYEDVTISGSELLPDVTAIQPVRMRPVETTDAPQDIVIPPHTLYGDYPPKIPEAEIKPIQETGEIVLSRAVIPEFIIVHDGPPDDTTAMNYYVNYTDYIKNVVSSEIYATWPDNAIYANTLAIMSFTLNRVYTEWYRSRRYPFTITNSTAYDQKWIYGRNIYDNVGRIVDDVFNNYLSRPGIRQPIFTSYCNGTTVTCNGLSQWGSKYLGDEGYSPIDIIRYYYGNDMYINSTEYVSGVPSSYPGYILTQGASGSNVTQLQEQLNRIAQNYPLIPVLAADGIYGPRTAESVRVFHSIFNLPQTGTVNEATWYRISQIFVGVSRLAEPDF